MFKTIIDFDIIAYNATFSRSLPSSSIASLWIRHARLQSGARPVGDGGVERDSMAQAGMSDGARGAAMAGPVVTADSTAAAGSRPDTASRGSDPQMDGSPQRQAGSSLPTASAPDAPTSATPGSSTPISSAPPPSVFTTGPQPPALEPRLAAVATIADPYLRQQVEANVRLQTQRDITAFTDGQRQAKAQAKQVIDQGGDLSSIPARLVQQIDMPGRQALRDYVLAHANPATDPVTYYGLKNRALDDPAGFQAVDLANYMARLNPADYAGLQQLQTSLKNGQPPADLPLQQAYKANTDRLLQQLGLPAATTATRDLGAPDPAANDNMPGSQQAALLRQAIDRRVAATEIATGRRMTPAEHLGIAAEASSQFQRSAYPLKNVVADVTVAEPKGIVADPDANTRAILSGQSDSSGPMLEVASFGADNSATHNEPQKLASSFGTRSLAECMPICTAMILPTGTYNGDPYYQCLAACQKEGKSGFVEWDKFF